MYISKHTIQDLELQTVLEQVQDMAISEKGKLKIAKIKPFRDKEELLQVLGKTDEYLQSFANNNRFPSHYFENIDQSLKLLGIENTFIEGEKLLDISSLVKTIQELQLFFKKFRLLYPLHYQDNLNIVLYVDILNLITEKIDRYGSLFDEASLLLKELRIKIKEVESKIAGSFSRALQAAFKSDLLDDIKESVVDGRRVLAVQSKFRKRVKGAVLATSKTGSIVYILPESTQFLDQELQLLRIQERDEEVRILKSITDELRPYKAILQQYQEYLVDLDVTKAKANYAQEVGGILPKISNEKNICLVKAYHPLLLRHNKAKGLRTIPQNITLHDRQRIIVISGPNAGGKSLTLKTIGLLQVMLQSGLLIPVDEKSKLSFFKTVLTDIGDNQSIENQLSTYSYRLKTMRMFLKKCDEQTLFLIDEFGTGSDPELGGALAEVFLETFYNKKAFGVITTHYTNIKVLANQLEFVANANMQFDKSSLQPLYELITGEAGSSFTFEVAQKMGIPYSLINRAKKNISSSKIRLDKTISKLQTERHKLRDFTQTVEKEKYRAKEQTQALEEKRQKIQEKLEQFQQLYDYNNKMLQLGRVFNQWLNRYFQTNNKKQLLSDIQKFAMQEQVKYTKKNPPKKLSKIQKQKQQQKQEVTQKNIKKVEQEILENIKDIRAEKHQEQRAKQEAIVNYDYEVGDIVRMKDGWAQGTVEKIEKKKLLINYGTFTALVDKIQVELIKS